MVCKKIINKIYYRFKILREINITFVKGKHICIIIIIPIVHSNDYETLLFIRKLANPESHCKNHWYKAIVAFIIIIRKVSNM